MFLQFDSSSFERAARNLGASIEQVPFALASTLNSAAFAARRELTQVTWPSSVQVHNPRFLTNALRVNLADKHNLQVEINDVMGRASLALHAFGGVKSPRIAHLAIPVSGQLVRGMKGIAKEQRPKALIASTPKRALRVTPRGIFIGSGGSLELFYVFKTVVKIPEDVPFEEDFRRVMTNRMSTDLPKAVKHAMDTARK
jgi:hypothetical protein